jgi:hypothetical protein
MFITKNITTADFEKLFEDQKAVFAETVAAEEKFVTVAEYFILGNRIATLRFPRFESVEHATLCFNQSMWFPRVIGADECIFYVDTTAEVTNSKNGETKTTDVFVAFRANRHNLSHLATPYYMYPDVRYPVWDPDFYVSEESLFSLKDIVGALHFAVERTENLFDSQIYIDFLNQNGFTTEFHPPFTEKTIIQFTEERY